METLRKRSQNDHCCLSPEPVGFFSTPNSTRAWQLDIVYKGRDTKLVVKWRWLAACSFGQPPREHDPTCSHIYKVLIPCGGADGRQSTLSASQPRVE